MSNEIKAIADDMDQLKASPDAVLRYDVMSDALVWSDELPKHRAVRELWCMRAVLRYRTGIILGIRFNEFEPDWEAAKTAFPSWIGFLPDRSSRSESLEDAYRTLKNAPRRT